MRLWLISRVAESFQVPPVEAERLLMDDPDELAIRILELRGYASALETYDAAGGKVDHLEQSPMMDLVLENIFALHQARVAEAEAEAEGGAD